MNDIEYDVELLIEGMIVKVFQENEDILTLHRKTTEDVFNATVCILMQKAMRESKGHFNPSMVKEAIEKRLQG